MVIVSRYAMVIVRCGMVTISCLAEGEWKDGLKSGRGKMTTKDGHYYEGEWKENKKWGVGKHIR